MKYAHSARRHIITISAIGLATAILVIAQALVISEAISPIITGHARPADVWHWVGIFIAIAIGRAFLVYLREALGHRAAEKAIRELREHVIASAEKLGPRWRARHGVETAALLTRGLDNLAPYFVKFLPQMVLTMTATPLALATILYLDFWSAVIAAFVVPLIPIFMILIGRFTQESTRIKLQAMERLGAQLLDLMSGLPTLRALGREQGPSKHLKELSDANTKATMATLRIAFLSGGALEFLATLSVALVAVEVGMRLVSDHLPLTVGLAVIMLAPEVFEPLRQVGAQFHASADGVAAANAAFDIIEQADSATTNQEPTTTIDSPAGTRIILDNVSVAARGAWAPHRLSAVIEPGTITALVGDSGVGKTTTAMGILGLEPVTEGTIYLADPNPKNTPNPATPDEQHTTTLLNLTEALGSQAGRTSWWNHVTWIPQSPSLVTGTLRSNLPPHATDQQLQQASELTGFDTVLPTLPNSWDTPIGSGGVGLSVGQRQRLALMNAFLSESPIIILDEPTAHLDAVSEETVVRAVQALKAQGRTVIVIAHRKAIHTIADHAIHVRRAGATPEEIDRYPILTPTDTLESLEVDLPTFLDETLLEGDAR